ncbi:helix-turn-helix transcriptional regulator [Actinomadura fulvescens]|uniref:Helix-turn-helix transcriptional regulator n=1 Tax=Actinomadura fulvescens TaxID=46160 RepID=A0ABN3PU64_9ACTN
MASRKPTPDLRRFGAEVTRLREESGITSRTQLAKLVSVTRSYVGQVENGTTRCRRDFAERLDQALDTGTALTDLWDDSLRSASYPKAFVDFVAAEGIATLLRCYENRLIYGLFQTPAYAAAVLGSEKPVEGRIKRQTTLDRQSVIISVVMDESVLNREVAPPGVMREQLARLLELSECPNIHIQIALSHRYYRDARGPFAIASLPDHREVVWLEAAARYETSTDLEEIAVVARTFTRLQAEALNTSDSRELIRRTLQERWLKDGVAQEQAVR